MAGEPILTIDQAIALINKQVGEIKNLAKAGLWEAGLKIMAAAQKRLRASVITGNLRASGYVRSAEEQLRPDPEKLIADAYQAIPAGDMHELDIEVGFTANYAIYVHEHMGGRTPKFLENVVLENTREIVEIVRQRSGGI